MKKVFKFVLAVLTGISIFSLGDALDCLSNPKVIFVAVFAAIILFVFGAFLGTKMNNTEKND